MPDAEQIPVYVPAPDFGKPRKSDAERTLIVGLGGSGAEALEQIRARLQQRCDPEQLRERLRLLLIDSDRSAAMESYRDEDGIVRTRERFTPREFFWLDAQRAGRAAYFRDRDLGLAWLDPRLAQDVSQAPWLLDGNGASGIRQLGRLLLYSADTVRQLRRRVTELVSELTDDSLASLRVLIVTGISGGTGSGLVVDASYLIRDTIALMPGNMELRTSFEGILLLPPTGRSGDPVNIRRGDRNGYAALKEIEHYMTLSRRNEQYLGDFEGAQIHSVRDLFEVCVLVDGSSTNMAYAEPRAVALDLVADYVLEIFSITDGRGLPYWRNWIGFAMGKLSELPEGRAPRGANYPYTALGYLRAETAPKPGDELACQGLAEQMLRQLPLLAELREDILPPESFPDDLLLLEQEPGELSQRLQRAICFAGGKASPVRSELGGGVRALRVCSCLPAYLFAWTKRAEASYEQALQYGERGLHRDADSVRLPALLPDALRPLLGCLDPREQAMTAQCRQIFRRALDLGLAREDRLRLYELSLLPAELRPDAALLRSTEQAAPGTAQHEQAVAALAPELDRLAEDLIERTGLRPGQTLALDEGMLAGLGGRRLSFAEWDGSLFLLPRMPMDKIPESWGIDLAEQLLRQSPALMDELEGSCLVLERARELLEA